jgi:threonine/homoserine/homoserine lactone efflux protein
MTPLLAGFGLGFSVAASFGPINLFALSSGLRYGFWPAYGVGVGAAVADGSYAFLGGLGAAALFTGGAKGWFQMLGGAALVFIAVGMATRRPEEHEQRAAPGFGHSFTVALGATLATRSPSSTGRPSSPASCPSSRCRGSRP